MKNKLDGSCCDGTDYMIADRWERLPDGKYRVLVHGVWLEVPAGAHVENVRNPYTEAIVWLYSYAEHGHGGIGVRCFKEGISI